MHRRRFLHSSLAMTLTASAAAQDKRPPNILLRSSWQVVNIGDIAHTPGVLALFEKHWPEAEVTLWASGDLSDEVMAMEHRRFPKLTIVKGSIGADGKASNAALAESIARTDFLLHGSGPSLVAAKDVAAFTKHTGKPFGVFGITYAGGEKDLLSQAKFVFFRDSVSLEKAKSEGVTCRVLEFGPDGAFACDLQNDEAAAAFLKANGLEDGKFLCCIPRLRFTPYWRIGNRAFDAKRHARNEEMKEHDHAPLRDAITAVVKEGFKVLLCPEDMSQMEVGKEMLLDKLPDDIRRGVVWREKFWLTDEALSVYCRSAGLFGLEMHSPIMGIGAGVPAIVCRFSEQTSKGVMWRDIGLGDWLFDFDREEELPRLTPAVLSIIRDPALAKAKAAKAREFVQQRQKEMVAAVPQIKIARCRGIVSALRCGIMPLPGHKTKIVATIGPASNSPAVLGAMIRAGMNVARLNFSHADFATHLANIQSVRAAAAAAGRRVAIMADLSGPKMRIGMLGVEKITLRHGDPFSLTTDNIIGDARRVSVSFMRLPEVVKKGDTLSLNDGYIQLEVNSVSGGDVNCTVIVGGELRSKKGLNLPGIDLGIGAFTDRDRECLQFALENGVDAVSQSFVESAADMHAVRKAARDMGYDPFLIAKIERARALDRLDEILDASDGIMIARGDLGVEIPIERIAVVQKDVMRRANRRSRPVITATQMLESMTTYRLPTRAEATDVSNAILDGTDCVMLSGESAMGAYPVEAVEMLARIAATVEPTRRRVTVREMHAGTDLHPVVLPQHLISISVEASFDFLKPAAVFARTDSGTSARRLSGMRLPAWIIAVSPSEKTCQDLLFSYGITPMHEPQPPDSWNAYVKDHVRRFALPGAFALLTQRPSAYAPESNHRMEIVSL